MKSGRLAVALIGLMTVTCAQPRSFTEAASTSPVTTQTQVNEQDHFRLFVPSQAAVGKKAKPAPLVVAIHGCAQDAEAMEIGTRFDQVAENEGFFVLYPDQQRGRNPYNCWRWFEPEHQKRGAGEPAEIIEMIEKVKSRYAIDEKKIYVTGISSGSGLATTLLACYPESFAGGALHSGPACQVASGGLEGVQVLRMGPPKRTQSFQGCSPSNFKGRLLILQGSADQVVNPKHAEQLIEDFVTPEERARSRVINKGSRPSSNEHHTFVTCYGDKENPRACYVRIDDLGHAWSGGDASKPFFDAKGPSATELIRSFIINGGNPFN